MKGLAATLGRWCLTGRWRTTYALPRVAVFLLLVGLSAAQTASALVRIEVRSQGEALAGASVLANGTTSFIDRSGIATLSILPCLLDLTVIKDGYLPSAVTLTVASGERRTVSIDLQPLEEEVVVTATLSNTRLQDQPLRVEVIDQDEIDEKAMMTPGSVARAGAGGRLVVDAARQLERPNEE